MGKAILVESPDGELQGVYIAGRLVDQGFGIAQSALKRYGIKDVKTITCSGKWLQTRSWFPDSLRDVVGMENERVA